jgi:peroxiredoxin
VIRIVPVIVLSILGLTRLSLISAVLAQKPAPAKSSPPAGNEVSAQGFAGIGVLLGKKGEDVVVSSLRPNEPAAASHAIQVGDRIIAVAQNNEPPVKTQGMTIPEVVRLIRGAKGTTVRLTIVRPGTEEGTSLEVSFVRGELKGVFDGVLLAPETTAPNVEMLALPEKKPEHLADFAGKLVVMEFWLTRCVHCQKCIAGMQNYATKYPSWKGKVVLITVNADEDCEAAAKHLKAKGWENTHNVQMGLSAQKAYHVNTFPTTYIVGQRGRVVVAANNVDIPQVVNSLINGTQTPRTSRHVEPSTVR